MVQSLSAMHHNDAAQAFQKALDTAWQEKTDEEKKKKSFAPSKIVYGSGRCARYWYYAFDGTHFKDTIRGRNKRLMEAGIDRHERIQNKLKEIGVATDDDIEIKLEIEDPPIFGFVDGVVDYESFKWVLEIKTVDTAKFAARKVSGKPVSYHVIQVLIYMHILDIDRGFIVYEDRNTLDLYVIPIEMKNRYRQHIEKLFGWMRRVRNVVVDEHTLPMRSFKEDSMECKYCPVSDVCWSDAEGEVKIPRAPNLKV